MLYSEVARKWHEKALAVAHSQLGRCPALDLLRFSDELKKRTGWICCIDTTNWQLSHISCTGRRSGTGWREIIRWQATKRLSRSVCSALHPFGSTYNREFSEIDKTDGLGTTRLSARSSLSCSAPRIRWLFARERIASSLSRNSYTATKRFGCCILIQETASNFVWHLFFTFFFVLFHLGIKRVSEDSGYGQKCGRWYCCNWS